MDKKYENMDEKDLLIKLLESQEAATRHTRILSIALLGIAIAIVIGLCVAIPAMLVTLNNADDTLKDAQNSLTGIDEMVGNVNTVVVDNTESVNESVTKINSIDIDTLNDSINSLNDAVKELESMLRP